MTSGKISGDTKLTCYHDIGFSDLTAPGNSWTLYKNIIQKFQNCKWYQILGATVIQLSRPLDLRTFEYQKSYYTYACFWNFWMIFYKVIKNSRMMVACKPWYHRISSQWPQHNEISKIHTDASLRSKKKKKRKLTLSDQADSPPKSCNYSTYQDNT